jgi:hypothetical protein
MLAAAMAAMATPALAQNLNTSASGTYGQVTLRAGFLPDPYAVTVNAGGAIEATRASEACLGFIDARATFTLRYTAGDYPLFISATSESDTTIAVRAPDGSWSCDDDSAGSLNPVVSWENPRSGRYQIWVGRYGVQGEAASATLNISEIGAGGGGQLGAVPPPVQPGAGMPDWSLAPAYGAIDLVAGFEPDPHRMNIAAGGELDASAIGAPGCVGWIARAPDYRVNWTAGDSGLPLIFSVNSQADTTLVINDPSGAWHCNDDGGQGLNPSITFAAPASGQYDIWVGTYMSGPLQDSTLAVSELYSE